MGLLLSTVIPQVSPCAFLLVLRNDTALNISALIELCISCLLSFNRHREP
jgi:hypothetical protein